MGPAAVFLGGTTLLGISEQRKARKATIAANRAQERAAAIQNARARRRTQAEARRIQATNVAQGAAQGVSGASTLSGVASSVQTQLASNISFQQQLQSLDQQRFKSLEASIKAQSNADTLAAVAGFADSSGGQRALSFIGIK